MDADSAPRSSTKANPVPGPVGFRQRLSALSTGQKSFLAVATALMVVGVVLSINADPITPVTTTPDGAVLASNVLPDGQPGPGSSTSLAETPWSEAIFRYGFSFFLGFACGYAVRSFLRLALFFVGVVALSLFALDYAGFVTVEWDAMDQAFSGLLTRIQEQAQGFRSFITGSLPSAGLAGFGLLAGFRKVR